MRLFYTSHKDMNQFGVMPRFDKKFKILGKYERLFEETDVYGLVRIGDGWTKILEDLVLAVDLYTKEQKFPGFRFLEVTERNGRLVIDQQGADPCIEKMIETASYLSQKTCRVCGEPGTIQEVGERFMTLCEEHALMENVKAN